MHHGSMDDVDRRIIDHLVRDGRAGYARIAADVGLSAPAVKRRVDRLVADGVVKGFTAVVDPDLMGWAVEAYVEVHCRGTITPEALGSAFARIPEIHAAATVSGQADAPGAGARAGAHRGRQRRPHRHRDRAVAPHRPLHGLTTPHVGSRTPSTPTLFSSLIGPSSRASAVRCQRPPTLDLKRVPRPT